MVSVKDFGAIGDGLTDDTAAIAAAMNYAFPLGRPVEFEGSFLVSGTLLSYTVRAVGSLHIICRGNVTITVSASAAGFDHLLYGAATAANNGSVTGGSLLIDLNNKCASGLTFRHNSATQSGTVEILCPVTVLNAFNVSASDVNANYGIGVIGNYREVLINSPIVNGVARTNASGACHGIVVTDSSGSVTINNPVVSNVLTPSTADADGILVFGRKTGGTWANYNGVVRINEPIITDCQVRSIKIACGDATVFRPSIYRQLVVSASGSIDIDFQTGGQSLLIEPFFQYKRNGGTSPINANHYCVAFQNRNSDEDSVAKSIGGVVRSEVTVRRYCFTNSVSTSLNATTIIDGLVGDPIGALATGVFDWAILEFDVAPIEARAARNTFIVRNCKAPVNFYCLTYSGGTGASLSGKCFVEVYNNENVLAVDYGAIDNISGSRILTWGSFRLFNNQSFLNFMPGALVFTFNQLPVGNAFLVDITSVVATGAPGWGGGGSALIEVLGRLANSTPRSQIRVTVDNAVAANTVFYSGDGGSTWGTIK